MLEAFTGRLKGFAESVAHAEFAYWVGSGVSRNRVPNVPTLVLRVIEHLRVRALASGGQRFADALQAVLRLVVLSAEDAAKIDLNVTALSWPVIAQIRDQLVRRYSAMLDVTVDGESHDYLLWTAAETCEAYGRSGIQPDVGHLAIAILILEGVASEIVTSNWDGLIENAVCALTGRPTKETLGVVVKSQDLRDQPVISVLYKFHGCAVLA